MITLFRRIRKKLLGENKFTRYLVYALGEIILVVIGILIALQINTWKEENTLRKKENDYLNDIHSFLLEDQKNVDDLIDFYEEKQRIYDTLVVFFDQKYNASEISNLFVPYMQRQSAFLLFDINSTAFENMMSANDISIITNKDLRHDLSYYYSQDQLIGTQERIKKSTREFRDYLAFSFTTKEALDEYLRMNTLAPKFEEKGDIRSQSEFYRIYFDTSVAVRNQISYLSRQKSLINDLLAAIEKEIGIDKSTALKLD